MNSFEYPITEPLRYIFSLAVNCWSNPAPSSIIGQIFPYTFTLPFVGFITPATTFKRVDLPAPFEPIKPITSPCFTLNEISDKAQNSFF